MNDALQPAGTPLGIAFYRRPTLEVAPALIGKVLVRRRGEEVLSGRIVETESYGGAGDRASHASRNNPGRARIMFGPPARAYVYRLWYVHHCLNFVTEPEGQPGAVLVRAVEPLDGLEAIKRNRGKQMPLRNLTSGPSKLCQALGIDTALNGADLCGDELWIEDRGGSVGEIRTGPRIGVEYAGEWALKPWRFVEAGSKFLSRPVHKRK